MQNLFIRERGQLSVRPFYENIVHFVYVKYRCRIHGEAYGEQLSIANRTQYQVPFYLIQGKNDHNVGTMVEVAVEYYEKVEAPDKDICLVEGGHISPLLCCDQLAAFVHKIAEKQK